MKVAMETSGLSLIQGIRNGDNYTISHVGELETMRDPDKGAVLN
jgi:hypothetical protein